MRLEVTSGKGQFRTPTWPKDSWSSRVLTPPERISLLVLRESIILLVGGIPTPLKNDGVRQLELWNSQFFMESHKNPWFQIPNHQPVSVMPTHGKSHGIFFWVPPCPTSHDGWWGNGGPIRTGVPSEMRYEMVEVLSWENGGGFYGKIIPIIYKWMVFLWENNLQIVDYPLPVWIFGG